MSSSTPSERDPVHAAASVGPCWSATSRGTSPPLPTPLLLPAPARCGATTSNVGGAFPVGNAATVATAMPEGVVLTHGAGA